MKEVINILEDRLKTEQQCFKEAVNALENGALTKSDEFAFKTSKEIANEMIPQLEKAILILKQNK